MPHQSTVTSKKIDARPHKSIRTSHAQSEKSMVNEEDRLHMISDAAYYRALGRGFQGGDPVEDWLMAEEEVVGMLYPNGLSSYE